MEDTRAQERIYYNASALAAESGYGKIKKEWEKNHSWKKVFCALTTAKESENPISQYEILKRKNISLIVQNDQKFPDLLKEIPHSPFGLYLKGNLSSLQDKKTIAIVGTRKATAQAKMMAQTFARAFAKEEVVVISGLALGIDTAAHQGALDVPNGKTIAVLGQGLDRIYPTTNRSLAEKIIQRNGTLISEYPAGTPSLPYRFLERNRIISGLSQAVLVIEAPLGSGSLATARFALEQNREVLVIPGPATHPNYAGSHALIRQGAQLVTNPEEVFESLGWNIERKDVARKEQQKIFSKDEQHILEILEGSTNPVSLDKIIELSKLSTQIVSRTITFLSIKNAIKETEAGFTGI
jgi:DNA processing protein